MDRILFLIVTAILASTAHADSVPGAKRKLADRTIERRFKRYGPYAGLVFWLYLTKDWLD